MVTYFLDNAEEIHQSAPTTFFLPSLEDRSTLKPQDTVKLIFRIEHEGGVDVERMWVQVERRTDVGYVGVLDNDPYCTEDLKAGAIVTFGPEHVIQLQRA